MLEPECHLAVPLRGCQRFCCGFWRFGSGFSDLVGGVRVSVRLMQPTPSGIRDSTASASAQGPGQPAFGNASGHALSMKWAALHDAAGVVGSLAGMPPEMRKPEIRNFPAIMRDTGGWRYDLAKQGVDDLASFMEPGLTALLAVSARGMSPAPAAQALWQEFVAARAALLALIPPLGITRRT